MHKYGNRNTQHVALNMLLFEPIIVGLNYTKLNFEPMTHVALIKKNHIRLTRISKLSSSKTEYIYITIIMYHDTTSLHA